MTNEAHAPRSTRRLNKCDWLAIRWYINICQLMNISSKIIYLQNKIVHKLFLQDFFFFLIFHIEDVSGSKKTP